ncbi:MAG: Uma2 family endonuclease [Saprospiraceae bacterium]|nr:Uma2 family endonuclease [Saprospiraceae bacterium]
MAHTDAPIATATFEEYMEMEYTSETRHEFINGEIIPMPYTSPEHGTIVLNLGSLLHGCFLKKNAQVWLNDRMVYVAGIGCDHAFYPDAVIVDGEPEYLDYRGKMKATKNPSVLVEVLSDSTEDIDRHEKWQCYQTLPSLKKYILISQKRMAVEVFERINGSGKWTYMTLREPESAVKMLACKIKLNDLYAKIIFPTPAPRSGD